MQWDGHVYPSLALTSIAALTATRNMSMRVHNIDSSTLYLGGTSVPLDASQT